MVVVEGSKTSSVNIGEAGGEAGGDVTATGVGSGPEWVMMMAGVSYDG